MSFHPDNISKVSESKGSFCAEIKISLKSVVSFIGSASFPVEVEFESKILSKLVSLDKRKIQAFTVPGVQYLSLLLSFESLHDHFSSGIGEGQKFFNVILVDNSEDEWVVNRVDVVVQEASIERISSCNDVHVTSHNIGLKSASLESGTVLPGGNENLSSQMTTFLYTWFLIFKMHSSGSRLNKHLSQLHYGGNTTKSSISICNAWSKEVSSWSGSLFSCCHLSSFLILLSIVKHLAFNKLVDFIWKSIHWIVSEIWTWLISSRNVC